MQRFESCNLRLPINKNLVCLDYSLRECSTNADRIQRLCSTGYENGEYRYLNADVVYEGELKSCDN